MPVTMDGWFGNFFHSPVAVLAYASCSHWVPSQSRDTLEPWSMVYVVKVVPEVLMTLTVAGAALQLGAW